MLGEKFVLRLERLMAHRGASPYAPENTIAAFEKARELGARAIEFDVMMNAEGDLFVFHDDMLKRTSNGVGKFVDASTAYITSLDAGSWFAPRFCDETIPTLSEALVWCSKHKMQVNLEIKPLSGQTEAITAAVLACLNRYWPGSQTLPLVSCFDYKVLKLCAGLLPELPLGVLVKRWHKTAWRDAAEDVNGFSVHLPRHVVTRERIQAIKQAGYAVCIYTVNSKKMTKLFWTWGADSVLSDYPDLMCV
jgi:glycerophosphoryl diester phosphodiesterase